MDTGPVFYDSPFFYLGNAEIGVNDNYIFIAQIVFVAVGKKIIPSTDCMGLNPVTRQNANLHAVIIDIEVPLPLDNFMTGIVKQVINIKFQDV